MVDGVHRVVEANRAPPPSSFRFQRVSAPGRGAIGIVEVVGAGALGGIEQLFRARAPRLSAARQPRARYGHFLDLDGERLDDGLVIDVPPASAESSDVCESAPPRYWLTLHGNPALVDRLLELLATVGGSMGPSVELGAGRPWQRVRNEALRSLLGALTESVAGFLLEQADLRANATGFAAWLRTALTSHRPIQTSELTELLMRGELGVKLLCPPRVVLAGVPNAGKSSLFNALLGRTRVVTHERAGTTRDLIEEPLVIADFPICLVDGAGLRSATDDAIEAEGVARMAGAIRTADLVVELIPPVELGLPVADPRVAGTARKTLQIRSRADQIPPTSAGGSETVVGQTAELRCSAVTGNGLAAVRDAILNGVFGQRLFPRGLPAPFSARHLALLAAAAASAAAGRDPREFLEQC
ncbi:MAG: GTPase [Planctomycetota bacterium]